jgi:hypothetical protein
VRGDEAGNTVGDGGRARSLVVRQRLVLLRLLHLLVLVLNVCQRRPSTPPPRTAPLQLVYPFSAASFLHRR